MNPQEAMVHLLRRASWDDIQSESPSLASIIRAGVEAGESVAAIRASCAAIEPDPDILDGAEMAIEYLREEKMRAILRRAEGPEERVSRGGRIETD